MKGSESGEFFGKARNTPEFGKCNFGSKPTAPAVLSQTQTTSLSNQTTQHITEIFGSTADAPVFGKSCQTTNAHPIFKGFNADETCSFFGTTAGTSTSNGVLIGQQNASMGEKTGGGCFDSSNSKTSFRQSKPVGAPLAQPTSNIFTTLQTSTAGNSIFGASTTVLGQTKTSLFNQTTQPNMGIFGSTNVVLVFGASCQTTTAHPKFEGLEANGTSSQLGTPTETSTSNGGLYGQQTAGNTVFGASTTGMNADGTCSLFGTPTASLTSKAGIGSESDEFFGKAWNTPEFGKCNFGSKPTALAVLSQTQTTSLLNQTEQHITEIFGSTADAPVFGKSCQTTIAHPIFKGFNADGTCSLFGTPAETSTSNGGLFGQQNASMGLKTRDGCFEFGNSRTFIRQSKLVGTPFAEPTTNIFSAPQTNTAGNSIFGASTTGHATSGFGATSAGGTSTKFNPVIGTHFENLNVGQQGAVFGEHCESPKSLFSFTKTLNTGLYGANENNPLHGAILTTAILGDNMHPQQPAASPASCTSSQTKPPRPQLPKPTLGRRHGCTTSRTEAQRARAKQKIYKMAKNWKARLELTVSRQPQLAKQPEPTSEPEAASKSPFQPTPPAAIEVHPLATEELVPSTSQAQLSH